MFLEKPKLTQTAQRHGQSHAASSSPLRRSTTSATTSSSAGHDRAIAVPQQAALAATSAHTSMVLQRRSPCSSSRDASPDAAHATHAERQTGLAQFMTGGSALLPVP